MYKKTRFLSDTLTMSKRCLMLSKRNIDTVLTSIIVPAMMMILFVYVFGGAMDVGDASYVNFIVPGIILQSIGQCASTTAISVSNDMKIGIIDRFCTMPIKKSSILSGHVISALIRNCLTTIVIIVVAYLIGFQPSALAADWLLVVLLILLYIIAMSWIATFIGIKANSPEGAGAIMSLASVLPYISSGFVPVESMPSFIRVFAEHQPMTPIIDSMRTLLLGQSVETNTLLIACAWCIGLAVVFYFLSSISFKGKRS